MLMVSVFLGLTLLWVLVEVHYNRSINEYDSGYVLWSSSCLGSFVRCSLRNPF